MSTSYHPLRELPLRYRLWLALLPSHVRDENGRELRDDLSDHTLSLVPFALDILRAAPAAHWDVLRQDLSLALRQLRRAPGFALIAGLTLAAGIGGNIAFFTLVDGVLLQQLPIAGADRIVDITEENVGRGMLTFGVAPANFHDFTRDSALFQAAAVYTRRSGTLRLGEARERVAYSAVSGDFFRVFIDRPIAGRTLQREDDVAGASAIVLSYGFWQGTLGGDPDIVGRTIDIDGTPLTVVGIMPQHFTFPNPTTAFWRPIALSEGEWGARGARFVSAAARLRPGVSRTEAWATVAAIARSLGTQHPRTNEGWTVLVRELRDARVSRVRSPLLFVWAAGALVMLIAVANVAGLFLTRAIGREREVALRAALGARTGRVVRQLVTEGLVLASLGAAAGFAIAYFVLERLRPLATDFVPRMHEVAIGGRTVWYTVGLVVITAALLAAVATSPVRGLRLWEALGTTRASASRQRRRLQRGIVVAEIALAVFVLVAGALVARSIVGLLSQPMGFDSDALLTFRVEPPWPSNVMENHDSIGARMTADRRRATAGYDALAELLAGLPGVRVVGAINRLPLTGDWWTSGVRLPESQDGAADNRIPAYVRPVTPGYFEAMGTRVLRGRGPSAADVAGSERVLVVDAEFARRVWGDANPVGREVLFDGPPNQPPPRARVVGVVEAMHMNRLDAELRSTMYVPFAQAIEGHYLDWGMDVVMRGATPRLEPEIRQAVRRVFPNAAVFRVSSMEEIVAVSTADRRFQLLVLGVFGGLALLLATIGVGGMLLLSVRERGRELAVRVALGARPDWLWWSVQRDALLLAGSGAVIGSAAALASARVFSTLVYGVSVRDPLALVVGPTLVIVAGFLAAAVPATRALRVSPVAVLRD